MVNDTISDFITRIRNAVLVRHKIVQTPATKITIELTKILKTEGLIEHFELFEKNCICEISLHGAVVMSE